MTKEHEKNRFTDEMLFSYLNGTASFEEREWVETWLEEHVDHRKKLEEYKVIYHWFRKGNAVGNGNKEESWSRIKAGYYKSGFISVLQDRKSTNKRPVLRLSMAVAAAVIIAFVAGFYVNSLFRNGDGISAPLAYNEVYVPLGARSQVTLSDGTKVWLNAGSRFRYPVNFSNDSREVSLEGEAYFDVTRMRNKIFIVKTTDVNIKVYGTQFNIKSYPEEGIIQTTLVEGSLSVEPIKGNAKNKAVFLKPNQTANYYKSPEKRDIAEVPERNPKEETAIKTEKKLVVLPTVDPLPITSWKDTRWVIVKEKLDDLAVLLERRYNVKIVFEDESLKNYKFSGTLKEETFEQVLKIVQLSAPILFSVVDNQVTFREDPSYKVKYDTMIKDPDN